MFTLTTFFRCTFLSHTSQSLHNVFRHGAPRRLCSFCSCLSCASQLTAACALAASALDPTFATALASTVTIAVTTTVDASAVATTFTTAASFAATSTCHASARSSLHDLRNGWRKGQCRCDDVGN